MAAKPNAGIVTCAVCVTPKSGKDEVVGLAVAADGTADNGKANKAVCKLLAGELGIAKGAVSIRRGETSHHKMLELAMDEAAYQAWYKGLPRL